jgi:type I restriction enzyme M protein
MSRVKTDELARVRRTLLAAADELRANSTMSPAEYRGPVLGLIFLAYAEHRFEQMRPRAGGQGNRPATRHGRRLSSSLSPVRPGRGQAVRPRLAAGGREPWQGD